MFLTAQSAAGFGTPTRPRCPRSAFPVLTLMLLALTLIGVGQPRVSSAQPDPARPIQVELSTDRDRYLLNEPIKLNITAVNLLATPQTLHFASGCLTNYGFDGAAFDHLHGTACIQSTVDITLEAHERRTLDTFVHTAADYPLLPGRHELWAEILGYGRVSKVIGVTSPDSSDDPAWALTPRVNPESAPVNSPIRFSLAVTNGSRETRSFVVNGCPVQLRLDDRPELPMACTEIARTITLSAGETILFGPDEYPYLQYNPHQNSVPPLAPGVHHATLAVRGVGEASVRFTVLADGDPGHDTGIITGQVTDGSGQGIGGVAVTALTYHVRNDTLPPPPGGSAGADGTPQPPSSGYSAYASTDDSGRYKLASLPAGRYLVFAAGADGSVVWYDNVFHAEEATPVAVSANEVVDNVDFVLQPGPPPPPPFPGVIEGVVLNWVPPGSGQPTRPVPGAIVVALYQSASIDTAGPPADSTGGPDVPPGGGFDTPIPSPNGGGQQRFYGYADSLGHYRIEVPYGAFRLLAGEYAHRYQWWDNQETFRAADGARLNAEHPVLRAAFALKPLGDAPRPAILTGHVYGRRSSDGGDDGDDDGDTGGDPTTGGTSTTPSEPAPSARVPLAGAQVSAMPLIDDPRVMRPIQLYAATSGPDGAWALEVPGNSPYILQAAASGFESRFYDHAAEFWAATPVDAAPAVRTTGLDFDLPHSRIPIDGGVLGGQVTSPDASAIDANGEIGRHPVANALVRIRPAGPGGDASTNGVYPNGSFEMVTRTDAGGYWSVTGLPTSSDRSLRYIVSAEADGYVPTYHPAAHRAADAVAVAPLPPYVDAISMVDVSLDPQPVNGPRFVAARVRGHSNWDWVPPPPGDPKSNGAPAWRDGPPHGLSPNDVPPTPPDSIGTFPLIGAFVYLVPVNATAAEPRALAGGAACDNGTLLITGLFDGDFIAYADRPGFGLQWFGGSSAQTAAVIHLSETSAAPLLDFVLEPLDGVEPPVGDPGSDDGNNLDNPMTNLRNAPNPSKPQTTIMYRLNAAAEVSLRVFDVKGRLVRTLFDRSLQSPGEQRVPWDGNDDGGQTVGAGMYFYQVQTASRMATGKMVVVR